jgi:hypothetical protein
LRKHVLAWEWLSLPCPELAAGPTTNLFLAEVKKVRTFIEVNVRAVLMPSMKALFGDALERNVRTYAARSS